MRRKRLEAGVWFVVLLGTFVWVMQAAEVGKNPRDEIVTFTHEKDLRTGRFFDVQVTKCGRCGLVISWVRFDHAGKPVAGRMTSDHKCDPKFKGARFFKDFDPFERLRELQRKLSDR